MTLLLIKSARHFAAQWRVGGEWALGLRLLSFSVCACMCVVLFGRCSQCVKCSFTASQRKAGRQGLSRHSACFQAHKDAPLRRTQWLSHTHCHTVCVYLISCIKSYEKCGNRIQFNRTLDIKQSHRARNKTIWKRQRHHVKLRCPVICRCQLEEGNSSRLDVTPLWWIFFSLAYILIS